MRRGKGTESVIFADMEQPEKLALLNERRAGTLMETLGIRYTGLDEAGLHAEMPVGPQVHQPMGLLHGGATAALAETLGSAYSFVSLPHPDRQAVVGQTLIAHHVRSVKDGTVRGTARFLHQGKRSHVVEIRIEDEHGRLVSTATLTNAILELAGLDATK